MKESTVFPILPLGKICILHSGGTPRRSNNKYYGGNIPWAKIADLDTENGIVVDTEEYITVEGLQAINNRIFPKGSILLAMYGSIGKLAIAGRDISCNQAILGIQIKDKEHLDINYLRLWLTSIKATLEFQGRGVTQQNISKSIVEKLEIPLPPLEEQRRIAAILDKADGVRRKRKEAIRLTEELLKSTFLEMFGDPVTNPKGWETHKLKEFTKRPITYGILKPGPHVSEGIPMLRIQDIHNGRVTASGIHKVSPELSSEYSRTVLRGGEIVISLVGTLGLTALIPESLKGANVHRNLGVIDIESEIVLSSFIFHYFKFSGIENFLLKNTKGGVQSLLNLGELREMPVNLPPLSLQQDFESLASNQIALNTNALSAYEQSENLFNSLLQRAFRGEL
jgi:type I restriction enzyme S subunit